MTDAKAIEVEAPPEVKTIEESESNQEASTPIEQSKFSKKSVFQSWLLLCFTTGPVASMARTYVPAALQSLAFSLGQTSTGGRCTRSNNDDCFVEFGTGKVHYNSYVLYLKAIYTALEGVVALLISGIADYSNYRKWILITSIILYGLCALPYAGLTTVAYSHLNGMSALYALLCVINGVYQILEASYIPLFMRARAHEVMEIKAGSVAEDVRKEMVLKKGSKVSVLGIVVGNLGGIVALTIGIIISYSRGGPQEDGYHNFLLAITVAGCVTVVSTIFAAFFIPSVQGKEKPKGKLLIFLTFRRMWSLLKKIKKHRNAFLLCVAWVIWNVTYTNFLTIFILLFRSTLGIGNTDPEYTVYTWLSYVISSIGSLGWMFLYPHAHLKMKTWAYIFLGISLFTNFWGCLGISPSSKVGFKHRWEFWVFDVVYSGSSSALRSLNRVLYSTLLPEGEEAQFFGLEVMLGVAVGWIGDLVNATIQDKTGIQRMPFVPNTVLVAVSTVLYFFCDTEQGMADVKKVVAPLC